MIVQEVKQNALVEQIGQPLNLHQIPLAVPQGVAAAITADCLNRWDGFLALRAKVDSNGRRSGIWMDRFETVRFGAMLLAMERTNHKTQQHSAGKQSCLVQAACVNLSVLLHCNVVRSSKVLHVTEQATSPTQT